MEEIKPISESKVEKINGRDYDVETIKKPRYTEQEKEAKRQELLATEQELEEVTARYSELKQLVSSFV